MWCRRCQQEVPAQGSIGSTGARCPRCQCLLAVESGAAPTPDIAPPPAGDAGHRASIDHSLRLAKAALAAGEPARTLRYDLAQHGVSPALRATPSRSPRRPIPKSPPAASRSIRFGQAFAWIVSATGATTLGLGIGLLLWSVWGEQPELWTAALAATLTGQGLLILGLVQLVSVLWTAGRGAAHRLAQMHEELRALRRATDTAAGRHAASATQFYADLTQNAGPEVLLGNLRGQLDALSARVRK